jgi:ubiquinone/menaquinone biosynthesis C-methylase UbiE
MEIKKGIVPESPTDYNAINVLQALEFIDVKDKKVLVVGCNTGKDCSYFITAGAKEIHGVDVLENTGSEYKHRKVAYHKESAEKMDSLPDNYFDLVFCFATMEHVLDIAAAFREMERVCKKGGIVYSVASPLWYSAYGNHREDFFKDYPWIHLCLSSEEIKNWFLKNMAEKMPDTAREIDRHIKYLFESGTEMFNKRKPSEYLDACNDLGMEIIVNEVEKNPSHVLTNEVKDRLAPMFSEDDLLGVTHRFVGRKSVKFSIIICTHNAAERLSKTLDSFLAQTFQNFEVVLIDGDSTDGTQKVVEEYEKKFAGKLKWISEKDSGLYNAINKGVKMSEGEFLSVVGAGDWLEKNALEQAAKCIEKYPEADAVFGKTKIWDKDLKISRLLQTGPEQLPTSPMQHPSLFYKKSLHDKFGLYEESYRIAADYAFCLKTFWNGKAKAQSFDAVIDNYVLDGISATREGLCVKENFRARREAGVKTKASLREALNFLKNKLKNIFLFLSSRT